MFRAKKINLDMLLLALMVVHLRLDSEFSRDNRWNSEPEVREVFLGSSSAYTQINFHSPYSNYLHYPTKSSEHSDLEDASILFSRLNYFSSFRHSSNNLIAYYAPRVQNVLPNEDSNSESPTIDASSSDPSLPQGVSGRADTGGGFPDENEPHLQQTEDLSPEDMDLIEILWKQDIDLGVTRDAYDCCQTHEAEKLKDVEYSKEAALQEYLTHKEIKGFEENVTTCDPWAGHNYTVDSETGEYIMLDDFPVESISGMSTDLLEDGVLQALSSPNSYLSFDENAQFPNLIESFSSGEFPELLHEDLTSDTNFLSSEMENFERELSVYERTLDVDLGNPEVQNDLFPSMEDCWQDITTILPLSVLGSVHQGSFATMLPRPVHMYHNGGNTAIPQLGTTPQTNPNDSFTSMLLQNASLAVPSSDENSTFHGMSSSIGPSSIGCAVAESMVTLTNDTEPIPSSSIVNSMYDSALPELLYPNQTAAAPHNEFFLSDLLLDDDLQLMDMAVPVDTNQNIMPKTEDHMDTSSDSLSLTACRVPSISDCQDWVDSCSESSSHQSDEGNVRRKINSAMSGHFNHRQNSMHFNPDMIQASVPKKHRHFGDKKRESTSRNSRDAAFENHKGKDSQYFVVRSPFVGLSESSACAMPEGAAASNEKFNMNIPRTSGGSCTSFVHHNHSYHLPFMSGDSLHKPVMRDKSKPMSDEEAINKDEKRANALKLPISIEDIINLAIDEFNERLSKYELTEPQLTLIRDIRRRGKNKVAAQNCRKRKMDQISTLQQDLDLLEHERSQLETESARLQYQQHHIQDKYAKLYQFVLQNTNLKPPDSPTCLPILSTSEQTNPSSSDTLTSDDDCDLSRGARTKRKTRK